MEGFHALDTSNSKFEKVWKYGQFAGFATNRLTPTGDQRELEF